MTKNTYIIKHKSAYIFDDLGKALADDRWTSYSFRTVADPSRAFTYDDEATATEHVEQFQRRFLRRKQFGQMSVVVAETAPHGKVGKGPEAYQIEQKVWGVELEDRTMTRERIVEIVEKLSAHFGLLVPKVEVTNRRTYAAVAFTGQNRLRFGAWSSDVIVAHEVAHLVAGGRAGHRKPWQDRYVEAIRVIRPDADAERLAAAFVEMRANQAARRSGAKLPTVAATARSSSVSIRYSSNTKRTKRWIVAVNADGKRSRRFFTTETEANDYADSIRKAA